MNKNEQAEKWFKVVFKGLWMKYKKITLRFLTLFEKKKFFGTSLGLFLKFLGYNILTFDFCILLTWPIYELLYVFMWHIPMYLHKYRVFWTSNRILGDFFLHLTRNFAKILLIFKGRNLKSFFSLKEQGSTSWKVF